MFDVLVAGHLGLDIIPQIPEGATESKSFLAPGRLAAVGPCLLATGGAVSNTGMALHTLGMNVRLVGRVGDDALGLMTRDIIARRDPALVEHLVGSPGDASSYTIVIDPPGIDRTFLHFPGTNDSFGPEDVPDGLLDQARAFHFGYPPVMRRMYAKGGSALAGMFRRAKMRGTTTCLDMAMPDPSTPGGKAPWRDILTRVLPYVDLFLPSGEELVYMLNRERHDALALSAGQYGIIDALHAADIRALGEDSLALGCKVVVIKLGHRGLYMRTSERAQVTGRGRPADPDLWSHQELWSPCFRVNVVGTVGAGDATIAGLLAAILRGQNPQAAMNTAVAAGACCVEASGATGGVQGWQQTQARIDRGWPRAEAGPRDDGWKWDERFGGWHGPDDKEP